VLKLEQLKTMKNRYNLHERWQQFMTRGALPAHSFVFLTVGLRGSIFVISTMIEFLCLFQIPMPSFYPHGVQSS
jgi:hypothetical protein